MSKRWLFIFRDMTDPKEVDRVIARLPQAKLAGYNGVALGYNVAPARAAALKEACRANGFELVAMVMGGSHDRNYMEGVLSKDALFVVHNGSAALQPDNPTQPVNTDFENANGNHFVGWGFQDDEGVTTFADHDVVHGGKTSLRIESVGKNQFRHARIAQPIKLQPHRQYRISFWLKTENLAPADPEVKVLAPDPIGAVSFQTFHAEHTQDWTHYDLVFNSLNATDATLYLGSWYGKEGKMWWDDLKVEEIGLVNLLRRPGCPVTVRSDGPNGTVYQEGVDYEKLVDPQLHPWRAYHDPPLIKLTPTSRIHDGDRLRVSYYHPIIVYEDRLTSCLSEPKVFDDWREEVKTANDLYHPDAFFMQHDELRVINQCALCQSKHMTPGELLAWNIHQSAQIIRDIRPDAEIWVWNDMFDPFHNAQDHFYAVNGSLKGSWKGLDPGIGIVNWNGGGLAKDVQFFSDLGLKQILSGYYDGDDDGSGITKWEASAKGIPGVVGAMYTTWEDKYGPMGVWAQKAWGGAAAQ
ncbi:MAG: carbohydrate binding domain-containing protein [Armatimonadota bacterium]|nr:carbohydrate binding domain-containing protein [Armatimonadota bacterium]